MAEDSPSQMFTSTVNNARESPPSRFKPPRDGTISARDSPPPPPRASHFIGASPAATTVNSALAGASPQMPTPMPSSRRTTWTYNWVQRASLTSSTSGSPAGSMEFSTPSTSGSGRRGRRRLRSPRSSSKVYPTQVQAVVRDESPERRLGSSPVLNSEWMVVSEPGGSPSLVPGGSPAGSGRSTPRRREHSGSSPQRQPTPAQTLRLRIRQEQQLDNSPMFKPLFKPSPSNDGLDKGLVDDSGGWCTLFTNMRRLDVHIMLALVLLCLVVLLPIFVWHQSLTAQDNHHDEDFLITRESHTASLSQHLSAAAAAVGQFAEFLRTSKSFASFASYFLSDTHVGDRVAYLPYIQHADRSAFEAQANAEYMDYLNLTQPTNISAFTVDENGTITGLQRPAPARSAYSPSLYAMPVLSSDFLLRDMLSEPLRGAAINRSLAERRAVVVPRALGQAADGSWYSGVVTFQPVYDGFGGGDPVGTFMVAQRSFDLISHLYGVRSHLAIRLRVFDITSDDFVDPFGCQLVPLFDGSLERGALEWNVKDDLGLPCGSSVAALERSAGYSTTLRYVDREWLVLMNNLDSDPGLEAQPITFLAIAATAAVLVTLQLAVILYRGRRLLVSLAESRDYIASMNRKTKDFLAFVTHELRNPLFGIKGNSSELRKSLRRLGDTVPSELYDMAESIDVSSDRMSTIISDVLSVRKIEEGKMDFEHEPFSVRKVVNELHRLFASRARSQGIELRFAVDDDVPGVVRGDSTRVVQVVSNLLSNAIKFTKQGFVGLSVSIVRQSRSQPHEDTANATALEGGTVFHLQFLVEDSGEGIEADVLPHLFSPYKQADAGVARTHGGTGLGLSIVKMLVEGMHGRVYVASVVAQGSAFCIILPFEVFPGDAESGVSAGDAESGVSAMLEDEDEHEVEDPTLSLLPPVKEQSGLSPAPSSAASASVASATSLPAPSASLLDSIRRHDTATAPLKVIVADDQKVNLRLLAKFASRLLPQANVVALSDGDQVVRAALAEDGTPLPIDIIFMDVVMPTMSGTEAVGRLRAAGFPAPIIAVSGSPEQRDEFLEAGFSGVLGKPFKEHDMRLVLAKFKLL